jgi:hypothetical protein
MRAVQNFREDQIMRYTPVIAVVLLLGLCGRTGPAADLATPVGVEAELSQEIGVAELRAHVYRLASKEFLGRKGLGAARASRHIAAAFERLKLEPAFGDSYFQPIPWLLADEAERDKSFVGRNVGGVLPGSDPKLKDEWVVLSAHFDHLGVDGDAFYPGADDNASGVAMLLEVAEALSFRKDRPKRSIYFVAFDQEEVGLQGSTHFAARPPRAFGKLKAFITADMLGRSMANVMDEYVFALGSESATALRKLVEGVKPPDGLKVGRLGADLVGSRSDYAPFRDRRVPFLFLSTGQHPDYHRTSDLPERIQYQKLARICRWVTELTFRLADDAEAPTWLENPDRLDLEEARTVQELLARALRSYPLNDAQRQLVRESHDKLAGIVRRGKITAAERTWLVWNARMMLLTVF